MHGRRAEEESPDEQPEIQALSIEALLFVPIISSNYLRTEKLDVFLEFKDRSDVSEPIQPFAWQRQNDGCS